MEWRVQAGGKVITALLMVALAFGDGRDRAVADAVFVGRTPCGAEARRFLGLPKTKRSFDPLSSTRLIEVLYLKGGRERREWLQQEAGPGGASVIIMQCDQRRMVQLNLRAKLYSEFPLVDWPARPTRETPTPETEPPAVTTTFDAVDTGERRRFGSYVAHRVTSTVTIDQAPWTEMTVSRSETDGWYVDLDAFGCFAGARQAFLSAEPVSRRVSGRHQFSVKGTARRGYLGLRRTTGSLLRGIGW